VSVRVVSLVPSSTETLLGMGAEVVACTRFCEQPQLLHVGGTKNPDVDHIVRLAPDLVVMDREENRIEDHDALVAAGLDVFVSDVTSLDAGLSVIGELAHAAGRPAPALSVVPSVDPPLRATAFVPIWRRPWMSIGANTYGGSLLRRLGIGLIDLGSDDAYPTLDLAEVAQRSPDLVLVPSEPYEFSTTHLDELAAAVPHAAIARIDGQDLFWWGVRTPAAFGRLSAALQGGDAAVDRDHAAGGVGPGPAGEEDHGAGDVLR
jgi:ABC-type hemin transport system substrate-binding protein